MAVLFIIYSTTKLPFTNPRNAEKDSSVNKHKQIASQVKQIAGEVQQSRPPNTEIQELEEKLVVSCESSS